VIMNKTLGSMIFIAVTQLLLFGCGGGGDPDLQDPDIVLILLDTVRSDHLSVNGYHRETTPVIDSLAASGIMWDRVQAQSSWTLPAMASIMTGLSQRSHDAGFAAGEFYGIDPVLPTIPLLLKRNARYQTAAFYNVIFMNQDFGFHTGFDHFDCQGFVGKASIRDAGMTVDDFLEWYDSSRDPERPLFTAIHFFDPHLPYSPPPPYDTLYSDPKADPLFNRFWGGRNQVEAVNLGEVEMTDEQLEIMVGLYDGEIAFTDTQIGRLITELDRRERLDNTVFVLVADHGEEFLDHGGFGHGHTLYQELLDVPLIFCGRGIQPASRHDVAAHIDLLPTLLGLAGVEKPIWAEGRDLFAGESSGDMRYVPSSNLIWSPYDLAALRMENRVIVGNPMEQEPVLYDLDSDPRQNEPLVPSRESKDQLFYYWSVPPRGNPQAVPFMESMVRTLRDLGYVN